MSDNEQNPLHRSLAQLSAFLITDHGIDDTLTIIANLAVDALPAAKFAAITMIVGGRMSTPGFTDPTCPLIDQEQYRSGRGPCLQAFEQQRTVITESLATDVRWPEFAAAATAHGVRSTLSLPMSARECAVGALNLYAAIDCAFGDVEADSGRIFAAQAAVVVLNAQAYWCARLQSQHLEFALTSREKIDIAKGIIMNATGCGPEQAFQLLVQQSQRENRKLRDVAAEVVARARRGRS